MLLAIKFLKIMKKSAFKNFVQAGLTRSENDVKSVVPWLNIQSSTCLASTLSFGGSVAAMIV